MSRTPAALLVLCTSLSVLAGCRGGSRASAPCPSPVRAPLVVTEPPPPPPSPPPSVCGVPAKRYRTCVAEGTWEAVRGGGRTIEELYFPEQGVVANLSYELQKEGDRETWKPVLNAFRGEIRNEYGPWCGPNAAPSPVEDVEVPAALATAIFEAAELRGRVDAARRAAGSRLSVSGILREVPAAAKEQASR